MRMLVSSKFGYPITEKGRCIRSHGTSTETASRGEGSGTCGRNG